MRGGARGRVMVPKGWRIVKRGRVRAGDRYHHFRLGWLDASGFAGMLAFPNLSTVIRKTRPARGRK